jgi:hypothetical protein
MDRKKKNRAGGGWRCVDRIRSHVTRAVVGQAMAALIARHRRVEP